MFKKKSNEKNTYGIVSDMRWLWSWQRLEQSLWCWIKKKKRCGN